MSKQPSTVQTTQNTTQQVPAYVSDAQQALLGYGTGMLGNFLGQTPNFRVAGQNADQQQAYSLYRQVGQDAFTASPISVPSAGYTPQLVGQATGYTAQTAGMPAEYNPRIAGDAAVYGATGTNGPALVDGASIGAMMNPFVNNVVDPMISRLRRERDTNSAGIGARAAAAGGFGGSGEAIQRSLNDRALNDQVASTAGQLMSQAYGQAAQLAGQNAQMRNADAQFNASATNASNAANAAATNAMAQFNAGAINRSAQDNQAARNNFALANAGMLNTAAQTNAAAQNQFALANANNANSAGQFNASLGLQSAQMQDALRTSEQNRRLAAVLQILNSGNAQQTQLQNILNAPLGALAAYQSIVPNQIPVTSNTVGTQPNTAPSLGQQLLGAGLTIGGMAIPGGGSLLGSLFACDARLKKNIAPYGSDARGRPLFAFHYAWEDDDAPLTIGPMAQIEEDHDPESVVEALGIKLVRVH